MWIAVLVVMLGVSSKMNSPGRPGVNIRPASTVIKRLSSRNRVFALVICSGSSSEETADYQRSAVVDVPGSGVRAMRVVHRAASGRAKPVGCCGCLDHGPCGGYVDAWWPAVPVERSYWRVVGKEG